MTASPRRRLLAVGIGIPAVVVVLSLGVMLWALPDLPDPVATHWGPNGLPDAVGSPLVSLVLLPVIVGGFVALATVVGRRSPEDGPTANQKLLMSAGSFLAGFLGVLLAGSLVIQRGVDDALEGPSILPVVLAAAVTAVLLAVITWLVLPRVSRVGRPVTAVPERPLGRDERAAWVRRVEPARRWPAVLLAAAAVLLLAAAGVLAASRPIWLLALLPAALVLALGWCLTFWTIVVDRTGVIARGGPGWPVLRVPLDDVTEVGIVRVDPIVDFGGWGLRWAPGQTGIVVRSGDALEVRRRHGRSLVVTVDGAADGAALLEALVRRHRESSAGG